MSKCGIFVLTQNSIERKLYLKTSLYFLFRNFNKHHSYPVNILHEGDYDDFGKEEIVKSIRTEYRHLINFIEIDKKDFEVPGHIDMKKVDEIIAIQPVPYWRNLKYRSMCYFWVKNFFKYTNGYDYVMRIDDDSFIEEPLMDNMFEIMKEKDLVYMSNIVHIDCGVCNYGMKKMFEEIFPSMKEKLDNGLFVNTKLNKTHPSFSKFNNVLSIMNEKKDTDIEDIELEMPLMYYNNFFVTADIVYNSSLSTSSELQLYRILQEALSNVIKYSEALAAKITILEKKNIIFIEIKDNGKGFDVINTLNKSDSFGLHNIIERSRAIGGEAKIVSDKNGTIITIEIKII